LRRPTGVGQRVDDAAHGDSIGGQPPQLGDGPLGGRSAAVEQVAARPIEPGSHQVSSSQNAT
jgi:hypothetical protein